MLEALFSMALLFDHSADPLQAAIDHYREVPGYRATVAANHGHEHELIHYAFQKPGRVRMDFVTPHRGAVLIYDAASGVAKLWPFGHGRFPALSLRPGNPLIRSPTGQRVDRSDVGALFHNAQLLQRHGRARNLGMETLDGRPSLHLVISADDGYALGRVAGYQLWLDRDSGFPLKAASVDGGGRPIETVELKELHIAPDFPEGFFRQ